MLLSTLCLSLLHFFINMSWLMSICMYGPYNSLWWFIGSVPQKLTSVCVLVFTRWSLSYCSTVTGACLMCFMFHMDTLPIFINHTSQDHPQWSSLLTLMIMPCIQGPKFSIWTTTLDPEGNK